VLKSYLTAGASLIEQIVESQGLQIELEFSVETSPSEAVIQECHAEIHSYVSKI